MNETNEVKQEILVKEINKLISANQDIKKRKIEFLHKSSKRTHTMKAKKLLDIDSKRYNKLMVFLKTIPECEPMSFKLYGEI